MRVDGKAAPQIEEIARRPVPVGSKVTPPRYCAAAGRGSSHQRPSLRFADVVFDALSSGDSADDHLDPAIEVHAGEIVEGDAFEHGAIVKSGIAGAFHDDAFARLVDDCEMPVEGGELLLR